MRGQPYKFLSSTIALTSSGEKRVLVTIPKDAIVTVLHGSPAAGKLVDVLWDHKVVTMFAIDLIERATAVHQ
jgi:hypothetical protein